MALLIVIWGTVMHTHSSGKTHFHFHISAIEEISNPSYDEDEIQSKQLEMSSTSTNPQNPYCGWCNKGFKDRNGLREHNLVIHGIPPEEDLTRTYLGIKRKSECDPNEVECSPEKKRKTT